MRQLVKDFISICTEHLIYENPVYEFGALQVKGQEGYADLRFYFPDNKFVGADFRRGLGVDVVMNLHNLPLGDGSVGLAVCVETLEHTQKPFIAVDEMYRVLKPNGICIISCPFSFPIHDYPEDYWRFTPEGFKTLLSKFKFSYVEYAGEDIIPHTVVGIGFKGKKMINNEKSFLDRIVMWKEFYKTMYGKNRKQDRE